MTPPASSEPNPRAGLMERALAYITAVHAVQDDCPPNCPAAALIAEIEAELAKPERRRRSLYRSEFDLYDDEDPR